jgi:hypothetical protein
VTVSFGVSCLSFIVSCWSYRVPLEDELHVELEVLTYVSTSWLEVLTEATGHAVA